MRTIFYLLISIAIFAITACEDSTNMTGVDNRDSGKAAALSGSENRLTSEQVSAILENLPNKGEWMYFSNVEEFDNFCSQYQLDKLYGTGRGQKIRERIAKEAAFEYPALNLDDVSEYRQKFQAALKQDGNYSDSEIDELLSLYDKVASYHPISRKAKRWGRSYSSILAAVPPLGSAVDVWSWEYAYLYIPPNSPTVKTLAGFNQPSSYTQRTISSIRGGWQINNAYPSYQYGAAAITVYYKASRDSLGVWFYQDASLPTNSGQQTSYSYNFSAPTPNFTRNASCQWAVDVWTTVHHWGWDSWNQIWETWEPYPTTWDNSTVSYNMGGRGDMDYNIRYDMLDFNRCFDLMRDPGLEQNSYEAYAGDANNDGTKYLMSDCIKILRYAGHLDGD